MSQSTTDSALKVLSRCYVFDPCPNLLFKISAKRYWVDSFPSVDDETPARALTLIFTHANGFHKEHWEPIIHRLFELQVSEECPIQIQDIWALDAPNHGDSAVLNEELLAWGYEMFSWEDYARCVHAFLAGLGSGIDVDFSKRNLVAVGHSMGAVAVLLSMTFSPSLKFCSLHLVEPVILGNYSQNRSTHVVEGAENRRDIWESTEDAYEALKCRPTWQKWDRRVLRIYVEHGLRSLPTAEYPDRNNGVTLKCTRKQEAATFRDKRSFAIAYRLLPHFLNNVPTHVVYGDIADFLRPEWKHDVLNNASGGLRNFASMTSIPGAGHLVVQTHPEAVANVIWKSLLHSHSGGRFRDAQAITSAKL